MMRCNKCGAENEDDARFCLSCGHKLRSRAPSPQEAEGGPDEAKTPESIDPSATGACHGCGKYLEAFVYAVVLAGGVGISVYYGDQLALYILAGVIGLTAWLRRI